MGALLSSSCSTDWNTIIAFSLLCKLPNPFLPCQGNRDVAAPLQGNSCYFWVWGRVALSPFVPPWLPVLGAGAAAPSLLPHLGTAGSLLRWEAVPRGALGECLRGPKGWGRVPGRSLGSGTVPQGGAGLGCASSPAVANAWHSSCISGTAPRQ